MSRADTKRTDTKRAASAAQTRASILNLARKMFVEHGYEGVTMRDLVKHSGYSTGAIFSHWSGKDDLFTEAMGRAPISDAQGAEFAWALERIASDHLPEEDGRGHIWRRDCDACNRREIALEALGALRGKRARMNPNAPADVTERGR